MTAHRAIAVASAWLAGGAAYAQPVAEWSVSLGRVTVSPLRFADVDGDGVQDLIVATMGVLGAPFGSGTVQVLDAGGNDLPGWPLVFGANQPIAGAAVAVGDVDADGDMELVTQGWFNTYLWNHDGTNYPGWPKATGTTFTASPALADVDGDDDLEVIVPHGATMHVFHHDGTEAAGWPQGAAEVFQAPAVGDVDGDGVDEIVAGTWRPNFPDTVPFELYMWETDGTEVFVVGSLGSVRGPVALGDVDDDGDVEIVVRAGDSLHVFDATGSTEAGWPVSPGAIRNATPSLGDLDGDRDLEIVIGGFDVHAHHHDGSTVAGWPVDVGATGNINSGVLLATIDGDGSTVETIVKYADNVAAIDAGGTMLAGFPYALSDDGNTATFSPTPVVGDVDGDGDVEYAFVSISGTLVYFDEAEPHDAGASPWPTYQHDRLNTAYLPPQDDCPWDCGDFSGAVGTADLLALLAQWGGPGPCDFDGAGAGTSDLLKLLANWGLCR